jgi:hypothetical protein
MRSHYFRIVVLVMSLSLLIGKVSTPASYSNNGVLTLGTLEAPSDQQQTSIFGVLSHMFTPSQSITTTNEDINEKLPTDIGHIQNSTLLWSTLSNFCKQLICSPGKDSGENCNCNPRTLISRVASLFCPKAPQYPTQNLSANDSNPTSSSTNEIAPSSGSWSSSLFSAMARFLSKYSSMVSRTKATQVSDKTSSLLTGDKVSQDASSTIPFEKLAEFKVSKDAPQQVFGKLYLVWDKVIPSVQWASAIWERWPSSFANCYSLGELAFWACCFVFTTAVTAIWPQELKLYTVLKSFQRSRYMCGRYVVLKTLGQGSYGEVFLAWDWRRCQEVAVKKYSHNGCNLSELSILLRCQSKHVVRALDSHIDEEYVYLVMPVCNPIPLKLSLAELVKIARDCLLGLAHIQKQGFVHLDIKIDNILLDPDYGAVIADFGVSGRMNSNGMVNAFAAGGTEGYMAPEVVDSINTKTDFYGGTSDVYSLGVTLQNLLPACSEPIPRGGLLNLVARMLEKDKSKRQTAQELVTKHKIFRQ